jgi:hypothetical protein
MIRSNLHILISKSDFTKLALAFLFIYKLTKLWKFNNMQFMSLNMLYNFAQATEYDVYMYAIFEYLNVHSFL